MDQEETIKRARELAEQKRREKAAQPPTVKPISELRYRLAIYRNGNRIYSHYLKYDDLSWQLDTWYRGTEEIFPPKGLTISIEEVIRGKVTGVYHQFHTEDFHQSERKNKKYGYMEPSWEADCTGEVYGKPARFWIRLILKKDKKKGVGIVGGYRMLKSEGKRN